MLKLNLGCGTNLLPGWENHDADVDLRKRLPWADASADFILLEHVLEHFNCAVGYAILEECRRVLRPGGVLRIVVPDVTKVANADPVYARFLADRGWGENAVRAVATEHGHEMLWTYDSLSAVLGSIGFEPARAQPRISVHPELCNVEGHHRVVGTAVNDIESLVVEGIKPRATKSASVDASSIPPVAATSYSPQNAGPRVAAKIAIVVASEANFFSLARDLIASIHSHRPDDSVDVCVLDLGLTDPQRAELRPSVAEFAEARWDLEFPSRSNAPAWFRAFTARPFLPRYFQGRDILIWIDADAWLQDWRAIELLTAGAADGSLAIIPELHRAFPHLHLPINDVRLSVRQAYTQTYGEELARQMTWKPVLNSGVFALRADAPLWKAWGQILQDGLSRSNNRLVEQCALNIAVATAAPRLHLLPQWANWPCHLAVPMLDRAKGLLVEPEIPYEPLSIVHETTRRGVELSVATTDGRSVKMKLDYPATRLFTPSQSA